MLGLLSCSVSAIRLVAVFSLEFSLPAMCFTCGYGVEDDDYISVMLVEFDKGIR